MRDARPGDVVDRALPAAAGAQAKRVEFIPDFGPGQVHLQTLWRDTHVHHVVCDRVTVAANPAFQGVTFAHKRLQRPGAAHSRQQAVDRNGLDASTEFIRSPCWLMR